MKSIFLLAVLLGFSLCSFSQPWVQKASLPVSGVLSPFSFSIGGMLYVGGGYNGNTIDSFFQYNPSTNSWTAMANVPTPIESSYGFVLNGMGYMVGGWTGSNLSNSVYMYNPGTNTWTPKNNFPGTARQNHVCLSANGKGYLFGGFTGGSTVVNDMWQYNDTTDTWIQLASCPGPGRDNPVGLVINNQIYVGMGGTSSFVPVYSDFYMFDPVGNAYTQMDNIPVARASAANFTLGNLGYVGLGSYNGFSLYLDDLYTYNPSNNTWTQVDSFGGGARSSAFSEVVNGIAYIGCGGYGNNLYKSDNWSYGYPTGIQNIAYNTNLSCYPSPTSGAFTIDMSGYSAGDRQISITDQLGQVVYQTTFPQDKIEISNKLTSGLYIISVRQGTRQDNSRVMVE